MGGGGGRASRDVNNTCLKTRGLIRTAAENSCIHGLVGEERWHWWILLQELWQCVRCVGLSPVTSIPGVHITKYFWKIYGEILHIYKYKFITTDKMNIFQLNAKGKINWFKADSAKKAVFHCKKCVIIFFLVIFPSVDVSLIYTLFYRRLNSNQSW
jgi:hypothetical protein